MRSLSFLCLVVVSTALAVPPRLPLLPAPSPILSFPPLGLLDNAKAIARSTAPGSQRISPASARRSSVRLPITLPNSFVLTPPANLDAKMVLPADVSLDPKMVRPFPNVGSAR